MSKSIRDRYIQYRTNPKNDECSISHFATSYGYSVPEVKLALANDRTLEKDILEARRAKYAARMQKIDDALFKAAENGETKAADLLYRRFDNYHPSVVEQTNTFYNFTDIIKAVREQNNPTVPRRPNDVGNV